MYHTKLPFVVQLFPSNFISFKSVGTNEMIMLHSFPAFLKISQRKRQGVKSAICNLRFNQLAPKLIPKLTPCFWPISEIFKPKFSVQILISQPNINQITRLMDQNLS